MIIASFFVPSVPQPGGSKKAFVNKKTGKPSVVEAGAHTKEWRAVVSLAAKQAYSAPPTRKPVIMRVLFVMPRPNGHYRTGRHANELRTDAPIVPTRTPDRTKLLRSTEDALTGIIWHDDVQVVGGQVWKVYGERPGALIVIKEFDGLPTWVTEAIK